MDYKSDTVRFAAMAKTLAVDDLIRAGPPDDKGFMWWQLDKTKEGVIISLEQKTQFQRLKTAVIDAGWDSSGYGYMMRGIQCELRD